MTAVRAESMPPLSPTTTFWNPHFLHVVAGSENKSFISTCLQLCNLLVHVSGQGRGVDDNQIFFE